MIGLFPDFSSVDLNDCQWKETETETSINCTGLQYDPDELNICLLYTSDAADERSSVDLGGRRIIKKKNT